MARLSGLFAAFSRTRPRIEAEEMERVKDWVRAALGGGAPMLSINEIVCDDPACPGVETVILILAEGEKTRAVKIAKPIEAVEEDDVRLALRQEDV